jgi:hypothetical protein
MLRGAGSALSFAHLAGVRPGAVRKRADDGNKTYDDQDDKKQADGESDEDYAKRMRARSDLGDDEKQAEGESDEEYASRMRAMDEDEEAHAEGDDENAEDNDQKRDDDDKEMHGNSVIARARRRERARCAAIFATKEAGANPVLAANLAFQTRLTRRQAIRVLRDTPAPQAEKQHPHSVARRNPNLGAGGQPAGPDSRRAAHDRMVGYLSNATGKK